VRTYLWDAENRLLQVNLKAQPGVSYQFRYDGLARRVAIIATNGTTTETRYLWCGDTLCQSRTATDTVSRRYYPEGEFSPPTGTGLYYSPDHLGSVRDVLNIQTGSVVASYAYDAYGQPIQSAVTTATDFRYAGLFNLQGTGLYLAKYRAYDPNTGRWLSRDPIGENGGINLYGYVKGNPVNFIDPEGLFFQGVIPGGELGGAFGGPYGAVAGAIIGGILGEQALEAILDPIYQAVQGGDDASEPKAPQLGDRAKSTDDPLQKLEDMEKAQKAAREGKNNKRIDCIGKSKQRAKSYLKGLTADDAADSDEDCGCE